MLLPRAVCKVRAAFTIVNKPFAPSLSPPHSSARRGTRTRRVGLGLVDHHAAQRACAQRAAAGVSRGARWRRPCASWTGAASARRSMFSFSHQVCQCRPYTALHRLLRLMLIDPDCAGASEACIGRPSRQSCCTGYQTLEQPVWPRLGARAAGRHPRLRTHLLAPCRQAEAMHPGRSLAPAQRMPARVHLLC